MRKLDKHGIPETSKFIKKLDRLFLAIESDCNREVSLEELALVYTYKTLGGVEGNGITSFFWAWEDREEYEFAIESFRLIGLPAIAEAIHEIDWLYEPIQRSLIEDYSVELDDAQQAQVDEVEERVFELFLEVPDTLMKFAKLHKIKK